MSDEAVMARIESRLWSRDKIPFSKMVSKISRFKSASVSDWACSIVENVPSSFRTKINFPFLDFFPTSSMGDLKTSI